MNDEIESTGPARPDDASLSAISTLVNVHSAINPLAATCEGYEPLMIALGGLKKVAGVRASAIGLESAQGHSARYAALSASNEGVAQVIREYSIKLIRWLKHISELVASDIEACFSGANATSADAEKLAYRAGQLKASHGAVAVRDFVKDQKLAGFFAAGRDSSPKAVSEDFSKFYAFVDAAFSSDNLMKAVNHIGVSLKPFDASQTGIGGLTQEKADEIINQAIQWMLGNIFGGFEASADGSRSIKAPFGGVTFSVNTTSSKGNGQLSSIDFGRKDPSPQFLESVRASKLPCLNADEVVAVCQQIERNMQRGLYRNHREIKSSLYKANTIVIDLVTSLSKKNAAGAGDTVALRYLKAVAESIMNMVRELYRYLRSVNQALLSYCKQSLILLEREAEGKGGIGDRPPGKATAGAS